MSCQNSTEADTTCLFISFLKRRMRWVKWLTLIVICAVLLTPRAHEVSFMASWLNIPEKIKTEKKNKKNESLRSETKTSRRSLGSLGRDHVTWLNSRLILKSNLRYFCAFCPSIFLFPQLKDVLLFQSSGVVLVLSIGSDVLSMMLVIRLLCVRFH